MAPLLSARGLALRYPDAPAPVLDGIDLDIAPREFVAVVGGSGVGKSTLLRALAGLVTPSEGVIEVNAVAQPGQRRRAIVFQDGRLLPWRTLAGNVAFGLEGLDLARGEATARIAEVLELTRMGELANRWPHQLSGGQTQRGGIARALAVRPEVLLMDEPFSAVDALTRTALQDELIRIWQVSGKAVLFVTHDIAEAAFLADRVIVLAGQPARIALDLVVDEPRPRDRTSARLAEIAAQIGGAL